MPTEKWNQSTWGAEENWKKFLDGEQWSHAWGGSHAQWYGLILPRISRFIPCDDILEIAPGYGRWTKFLIHNCNSFTAVDISTPSINHCTKIWGDRGQFIQTDGKSLPLKNKFDFVFSFDSLVHVEYEVIRSYIKEILNVIKDNGFAFIHHSNLYEFRKNLPDNIHARALSVSAEHVRTWVQEFGGKTVIQEKVNWGTTKLIDCFTLFTTASNSTHPITTILDNDNLMDNASHINQFISPYHKI
jgi:SAM-dependent methyltransferase